MIERTIIAVVSELRKSGLTVEQQILVDELIMLIMTLQSQADACEISYRNEVERVEDQRAVWREEKRVRRMSQEVCGSPKTSPTPPRDIKTKNKITPNPPLETEEGFAEWYAAYPRKEAPRAAAKAYRHSIKRGGRPENLLLSAKRYAREVAGREKQYIKTPAAWLNADCHLDEETQPKRGFLASPARRPWKEIQAERESKP